MPKLRDFALSFALPVLLLLIGRSEFVSSSANGSLGFQWVISAGLTGSVIVIHLAVFLLLYNAEQETPFRIPLRTLSKLATALIVSSYVLLINEYRLIDRIDEFVTGFLMEEFRGSWTDQAQRFRAIVDVIYAPLAATHSAMIPVLWFIIVGALIWSFSRMPTRVPKQWMYPIISAALVVGLLAERVSVDDLPGYSLRRILPITVPLIGGPNAGMIGPLMALIPLVLFLLIAVAPSAFLHPRSAGVSE